MCSVYSIFIKLSKIDGDRPKSKLVYFTKVVPSRLKEAPHGNYKAALALDTKVSYIAFPIFTTRSIYPTDNTTLSLTHTQDGGAGFSKI